MPPIRSHSQSLLHILMDTFPALYQRTLVPLWSVEIWAALWTAIIVFIAVKLYRKMKVSSSAESVKRVKSEFVKAF